MSGFRSEFLRTLEARGFIHQCTDFEALDALAAAEPVTVYVGYDATADSLHVGHLVSIMALRWAQKQHLSAEDALSYPREFEHFTLARLLIAHAPQIGDRSTLHDTIALLARLYDAASDGMRVKSQIEAQMLLALALQAQGRLPAALGRLAAALALAAPEGFARLFLDEGPPMVTLLKEGSKREIAPAYLPQLLALVGETAAPPVQTQPLVESLTARELEVLRFLATEMSGPEIASELVISMNTMRTHSKRIYSKLGVGSRRAAVNRATAIGLL